MSSAPRTLGVAMALGVLGACVLGMLLALANAETGGEAVRGGRALLALRVDERAEAAGDAAQCRIVTGSHFVADEHGSLCRWQELDTATQCCPAGAEADACKQCDNACCSLFEACVACCQAQPDEPMVEFDAWTDDAAPDRFDRCRAACRTSSASVEPAARGRYNHHNKHCFADGQQRQQLAGGAAAAAARNFDRVVPASALENDESAAAASRVHAACAAVVALFAANVFR